jgi:Fe-Mn family superoxide dismutase
MLSSSLTILSRAIKQTSTRQKYTLPDLPYDYNALEPVISADIMHLHHAKHHATYVNNLNVALEQLHEADAAKDAHKVASLSQAIKFNAGGHANHTLFWQNLCPLKKARGEPHGKLAELITRDFGSFQTFKDQFAQQTVAIQGSGWGWLGLDKKSAKLGIASTANQDPLVGMVPLLGVDVWEHAYYLQYKNARADYLKAIWQIVNWDDVAARLSENLLTV